jgi:hypothetical protein
MRRFFKKWAPYDFFVKQLGGLDAVVAGPNEGGDDKRATAHSSYRSWFRIPFPKPFPEPLSYVVDFAVVFGFAGTLMSASAEKALAAF